jgi:SAM-dependent methyltransferase
MDLRERPATLTARHPWETVRAQFFCRMLADLLGSRPVDLLDIGAGDGFVGSELLDRLPDGSSVLCVDEAYTDEHIASLRGTAPQRLGFARACPERTFDALVLLDVLEHVADDRGFLADLAARRLRPGGLLLASVPAHRALYTQHDVALGHYRRYSAHELRGVVIAAGLTPRRSGSLFGSLLVPRAIGKVLERARRIRSRPAVGELADQVATGITGWRHGPVVTSVVRGALAIDARLCELAARWSAPSTGLSVWVLCERPT